MGAEMAGMARKSGAGWCILGAQTKTEPRGAVNTNEAPDDRPIKARRPLMPYCGISPTVYPYPHRKIYLGTRKGPVA